MKKSQNNVLFSDAFLFRGKAGGYGIQGIASTFVREIEGDYNNVIGLPLCRLAQSLKEIMNQQQEGA